MRSSVASPNSSAEKKNGPASVGTPYPSRAAPARRREAGADYRTQGRRPHDQGEMAAPKRRGGEIDGGIAGLEARGSRAAEEKEAGEQQRNRVSHGRRDDDERPHRRDEVTGRETRPAAVAPHDRRGRHREQRGADHHGALRDSRQTDARDVGGEQRADRRADRDADAADDLRGEEESQSPTLDDSHFHGNKRVAHRVRRSTTRPVDLAGQCASLGPPRGAGSSTQFSGTGLEDGGVSRYTCYAFPSSSVGRAGDC